MSGIHLSGVFTLTHPNNIFLIDFVGLFRCTTRDPPLSSEGIVHINSFDAIGASQETIEVWDSDYPARSLRFLSRKFTRNFHLSNDCLDLHKISQKLLAEHRIYLLREYIYAPDILQLTRKKLKPRWEHHLY
jgi:hypothetical protein